MSTISDFRSATARIFLFALCVSLAAGCAPAKHRPEGFAGVPSPVGVLDRLSGKNLMNRELRGVARITFQGPEGTYTAKYAVLARFPDALRVESIPPIGPPDIFVAIKGNSLKAYIPGKKVFYIGTASRKNLSHFFPFPLEVRETIPILMGALPPGFAGEKTSLKGTNDGGHYRVDVLSGGERLRSFWVDLSTGELVRVDFSGQGGKTLYSARLDDFEITEGVPVPQRIDIGLEADGSGPLTLRIRYSDLQLSSGGDEAVYDLPIPPGVEPLLLN